MAGQSPSSSPRLPSPPPMAEDQIGPTSPGVSLYEDSSKFPGTGGVDVGASRRIRPGTRAEDMAEGPPLVDLQAIDSAFPLTEHLKALHYSLTHPNGASTFTPISVELAKKLSTPPTNTSKDIWLYELGRFLIQKTNSIIVGLFADSPACSAQTCPEMRASEWQYLCAVHDPPKSCSAIDYCCHTLDWAATTLTSSKMYPSRLALGSGTGAGSGGTDKVLQQQMKELTNIFRRVYRIYAHAWFQHREMFWRVEGKTGLYVLFKTVCDDYGLIQSENYTIPPEAEGLEPSSDEQTSKANASTERRESVQHMPTLLKRDDDADEHTQPSDQGNQVVVAGETTKRHRHTLSDRSGSVSTVIQEENEDEEDGPGKLALPRASSVTREISEPSEAKVEPESRRNETIGHIASKEEVKPGVVRSDTLKPEILPKADDAEPEDDVEVTVIEIGKDGYEPEDGATTLESLKTSVPVKIEDTTKISVD